MEENEEKSDDPADHYGSIEGDTVLRAVRMLLIILLNMIFYSLTLFGCIQIVDTGYSFAYDVLGETMAELPPGNDHSFVIERGDSEYEVACGLAAQKLVKSRYSFYLRMKLEEGDGSVLQPGVYQLNTSMTYEEILSMIYGK